MLKKLVETTAGTPLGYPSGTKLFKIPSGAFAGRQVAVLQTAAAELQITWADPPYVNWSTPASIATDAADSSFDCAMDSSGNLHLLYTENGTDALVTRKLTFSGGDWTVGSKVTVFDSDPSVRPSALVDHLGTIWVGWARQNSGLEYVNVKSSSDGGTTWGSGSSDGGDVITPGTGEAHVRLLLRQSELYAVYVTGASKIASKSHALPSGSWGSESVIATVLNLDEHFDAAVSSDGLFGVTYDHGELKFREHDGDAWGAVVTLDAAGALFPQVRYVGNVPIVYYLSPLSADQVDIKFVERRSGSFSVPQVLDSRAKAFDHLLLYHSGSDSIQELTAEAEDAATADVLHTGSGRLFALTGDRMYVGMAGKFRMIKLHLSTVGSGGVVSYSYWNGNGWVSFTPANGAFAFDAADHDLLLWNDFASVPDNWQPSAVNDETCYWVKIEVTGSFTTGPIGSQLTAISAITGLSVRR